MKEYVWVNLEFVLMLSGIGEYIFCGFIFQSKGMSMQYY